MLINNKNVKIFAESWRYFISDLDIEVNAEWSKHSLLPFLLSSKARYRKIKCEFLISGTNESDLENKISNLLSWFTEVVEIEFDKLDIIYTCFLQGNNIVKTPQRTKKIVSVDLIGYASKASITETANRITSKTINVPGNTVTPAIVEITPSIDIIDIAITGLSDSPITVKNLKAGKRVILNGEDVNVLQEGVNKFGDTDMWEFPRLKPGTNTITFSKSNCDIAIKYKPRWI